MRRLPSPALLLTAVLSGCAGSLETPEEALHSVAPLPQELTAANGTNLNGTNLNGTNLNGTDLSQFLVSTNFTGAMVNGYSHLDSLRLEATRFTGQKGSAVFTGTDFLYADFLGNLGDGSQVQLRITGMSQAPEPNADLFLYEVKYLASDATWQPACRDAQGNPALAMPMHGVWDYRQDVPGGGSKQEDPNRFTFACVGGAIAKCALWGYRPWMTHNDVPLAAYHQACTRLVRADYCGTGRSYTQNGSRINLYDDLDIQQDTENWVFEAEWDANGARCFYPLNRSHAGVPCYDSRVDQFCGQTLTPSRGVLLRNETPSAGLLP
jgi:hypothetical protein